MQKVVRWITTILGGIAVGSTLLSLSRNQRWYVRIWDFPRLQIATLAAVSASLHSAFFRSRGTDRAFLGATLLSLIWQIRKIYLYTPLARVQVEGSRADRDHPSSFQLLIANVKMENTRYDRLLDLIRQHDPDLVLAVETDSRWEGALDPLSESYPYAVRQPQDNHYGMLLFSRLRLIDPRVEFLVQDDIPSIHTAIELPSGDRVCLYGVHPRPPHPAYGQDTTPRDAELVILGRTIGEGEDRPTIVAGDLNDVSWSETTALFLRLSGLLDPRIGRGLYNTHHADRPLFRWPLDHVFHSNHFRLVDLQVLPHIGSDHFPVLMALSYEPDAPLHQPEPEEEAEDTWEARKKLESQAEAARTGEDRPSRPER